MNLAGLREKLAMRSGGLGIVVLAAVVLILVDGGPVALYQLGLVGIYAVAALGQQWLIGRTGQASIGAAAFIGIGATIGALVSDQSWGVFPLPLIAAGLAGAGVGLLVGLTSFRLRGLYLFLSTLALQFIVAFWIQEYEGTAGDQAVTPAHIAGQVLSVGRSLDIAIVVVLVLTLLLLHNLYRSTPGLAWSAVRQGEQAAAVAGINVTAWRLSAFVGSSAVTAVAGALYAYQIQAVSYQAFSLDMAIMVIVMVYLGGERHLRGAVIGATFVTLLPYGLQRAQSGFGPTSSVGSWLSTKGPTLDNVIYGVILVLVLLYERDGLIGLVEAGSGRRFRTARVGRPLAADDVAIEKRDSLPRASEPARLDVKSGDGTA